MSDETGALIPVPDDEALQAKRSQAIVAYAVALVALANENGLGPAGLAAWLHRRYAEHGYFDELARRIGSGNVAAVASEMASGRRLVHRDVRARIENDRATVVTETDWSGLNAQCFHFDTEADDVFAFFDEILRMQGLRLGVSVSIERTRDEERLELAPASAAVTAVEIRTATTEDADSIRAWLRRRWGSEIIAERGATYDASASPAFVAERGGEWVGLATYRFLPEGCHLLTLDADPPGTGVGRMLIERIKAEAQRHGAASVSLITTNDNLPALAFYQRCGFALTALSPGAVAEARARKPSIPQHGFRGIPVRDELKLEWTA